MAKKTYGGRSEVLTASNSSLSMTARQIAEVAGIKPNVINVQVFSSILRQREPASFGVLSGEQGH